MTASGKLPKRNPWDKHAEKLDALTAELPRVIQQTMEPESVSIMLFDRSAVERRSKVTVEQNSVR